MYKNLKLIGLITVLTTCLVMQGCQKQESSLPTIETKTVEAKKKNLLDQDLKFTYSSVCQMRCFNISTDNVRKMIEGGDIKTSEKLLKKKPCPIYAVEGKIPASEVNVLVLVAYCKGASKVVGITNPLDKAKCNDCIGKQKS